MGTSQKFEPIRFLVIPKFVFVTVFLVTASNRVVRGQGLAAGSHFSV